MDERKTLANCDAVEFLTQGYKIVDKIQALAQKADFDGIRSQLPEIDEKDTPEEIKAKGRKQGAKNIAEMLKKMCNDFPKETAEILRLYAFDDECKLSGFELITVASSALLNQDVLNFFTCALRISDRMR